MSTHAVYWVGDPNYNEHGGACLDCGQLPISSVTDLELKHGRFTQMHIDIIPGVIGVVTERGRRIALCETDLIDNDTDHVQEQITEWVEGCW